MSDDVTAYLETLVEFYDNPDCMAMEPPRPGSFETAMDVAAACATAIASLLQYQATGELSMEPAEQFTLAASQLITEHHGSGK